MFLFSFMALASENIKGHACYRFSDQESIAAAREIALAKRDALEGYAVFVSATSLVENMTLKNEIITSITGSILNNMKIIHRSEDLAKRKVCRSIVATVEPVEVKKQISLRIKRMVKRKFNFPTGLYDDKWIKVLKIDKEQSRGYIYTAVNGVFDRHIGNINKVNFFVFCKREHLNQAYEIYTLDENNFPILYTHLKFSCSQGKIITTSFDLKEGDNYIDHYINWSKDLNFVKKFLGL